MITSEVDSEERWTDLGLGTALVQAYPQTDDPGYTSIIYKNGGNSVRSGEGLERGDFANTAGCRQPHRGSPSKPCQNLVQDFERET